MFNHNNSILNYDNFLPNNDNYEHISSTSPLQASIQLTEVMLTGEEQTVEFQAGDESGKFIISGAALAASAVGGIASGVAGKKCSVM